MNKPLKFTIEKKLNNTLGRVGVISTPHGDIQTPAFVTVGTKGTVKALSPEQVKDLGAQVVLANTYHLYLQPHDYVIRDAGGIHKFMNWSGPTMTDSGGFQVFSLGAAYGKNISKVTSAENAPLLLPENGEDEVVKIATIDHDGVTFKSIIDGSLHYFTPERSIEIQHNIGADIIFAFDECTSPNEPLRYQQEALDRTHRWARKSLEHHKKLLGTEFPKKSALFGIVQGGRFEELRKESAKVLSEMDFDGYGIGGSFAKEDMGTAVKWVNEILPEEKPRHLLGIGEPEDLFMAVENGCDLFDCVAPTRIARNGQVYTKNGKENLLNNKFIEDFTPIDEGCECYTCKNYSRAYIAHLFRAKEMFAATLTSIHNLYFIINLVKKMRQSILDDTFHEFKNEFLVKYRR
ncbi:MAG: tRNA guanosine(34) transglycosylase Tgt [bacterium]